MTNAKKEFTREEVQDYANWWKGGGGPHSHSAKIAEMLEAFAARLAEDEASKPVWVNVRDYAKVMSDIHGDGKYSKHQTEYFDTPLYTRSKP